jgi:hypothetical protein
MCCACCCLIRQAVHDRRLGVTYCDGILLPTLRYFTADAAQERRTHHTRLVDQCITILLGFYRPSLNVSLVSYQRWCSKADDTTTKIAFPPSGDSYTPRRILPLLAISRLALRHPHINVRLSERHEREMEARRLSVEHHAVL